MKKLRANWSDEAKEKNRIESRIRMRRMREKNVKNADRKPYSERKNGIKDLTIEEKRMIKTQQRQEQRRYHSLKKNEEVSFNTFVQENISHHSNEQIVSEENNGANNSPVTINKETKPMTSSRTLRRRTKAVKLQLEKLNKSEATHLLKKCLQKYSGENEVMRIEENSCNSSVLINSVKEFLKPKKGSSLKQREFIKLIKAKTSEQGKNNLRIAKMIKISVKRLNAKKENRGRKFLSDDVKVKIIEIYEGCSRPLPYKPKNCAQDCRVMELSIRDAFKKFTDIYGPLVSAATFKKYRPKHIRCSSIKDFHLCLCEICLNSKLKLESLAKNIHKIKIQGNPNFPQFNSLHELSKLSVCEIPNDNCFENNCENCRDNLTKCFAPIQNSETAESTLVSWKTWKKEETDISVKSCQTTEMGQQITVTKKVKKMKNTFVVSRGNIIELIHGILQDMKQIPKHLQIADHQQWARRIIRLNQPSEMIVVDVDYSENIKEIYREEPQSAHYSRAQFTLFPAAVEFIRDGKIIRHDILCLSDDLTHDADQVYIFLKAIFQHLVDNNDLPVNPVYQIFSDRCPNQFSNRFLMKHISDCPNITWNFYGVRHGKNMSDTAGANFKTLLSRHVVNTGADINSLESFLELQKYEPLSTNRRRSILVFPHAQFEKERNRVRNSNVTKLVGIKKLHQVISKGNGNMLGRPLSCFCENCIHGKYNSCQNKLQPISMGGSTIENIATTSYNEQSSVNDDSNSDTEASAIFDIDLPRITKHGRVIKKLERFGYV